MAQPGYWEPPQQWFQCDDCEGEGGYEKSQPTWDDPYFAIWVKCERCRGAGGWLNDAETISSDAPNYATEGDCPF